jgi:alkylation response protein AidB-like acyl-CoA dehydrogenase
VVQGLGIHSGERVRIRPGEKGLQLGQVHLAVQVRRAVDLAAEILGGSAISNNGEFARLWRDSRGIAYHPPSDALAHEQVAKAVLGIDPTEPRW